MVSVAAYLIRQGFLSGGLWCNCCGCYSNLHLRKECDLGNYSITIVVNLLFSAQDPFPIVGSMKICLGEDRQSEEGFYVG